MLLNYKVNLIKLLIKYLWKKKISEFGGKYNKENIVFKLKKYFFKWIKNDNNITNWKKVKIQVKLLFINYKQSDECIYIYI